MTRVGPHFPRINAAGAEVTSGPGTSDRELTSTVPLADKGPERVARGRNMGGAFFVFAPGLP